ncbi:hypothetical protein Misp02_68960 [Microtetraspora sp. NBRC 16547]|nr:hypothetical protein Misp02_68960 [Microtetraspora sp. NBRC 16547]
MIGIAHEAHRFVPACGEQPFQPECDLPVTSRDHYAHVAHPPPTILARPPEPGLHGTTGPPPPAVATEERLGLVAWVPRSRSYLD